MTAEFLSKNPEKALFEVKEKLYERLATQRRMRDASHRFKKAAITIEEKIECGVEISCLQDEVDFLKYVLDIIERS